MSKQQSDQLSSQIDGLSDLIKQQSTQSDKKLDQQSKQFDEKLDQHSTQFDKKLDQQSKQLDEKLDQQSQRLETQIDKMFALLQEHVSDSEKRFKAAAKERADIRDTVAGLSGKIDGYHQELLMLGQKVDRLEQAIHHIAQETGVKLKFDL